MNNPKNSVVYFTSIVPNYLAKARVLCKSLKKYNPGSFFVLGISDSNSVDKKFLVDPFDAVITFDSLNSINNKKSFTFKHTVSELCTAVKPFFANEIITRYHPDKVIYLDPDIVVFDSLEPLSEYLDNKSIILTPHQLAPEKYDPYIRDNEILFLKRGTYNLGFFGVKSDPQGLEFLNWWQDRLLFYCFDDDYEVLPELSADHLLGMFTDQKWIDLVPSFFSNYYIIRDPGYNVCTWNLSNRHVKRKGNGKYSVNESPLRFFHFSGYDSGGHRNELLRLLQYYPHNKDVVKLSNWYKDRLSEEGQDYFGKICYSMDKYNNGRVIQNFERKIYHIRKDTYDLFGDPYKICEDEPCFYYWIRREYPEYFDVNKQKEQQKQEGFSTTLLNKWFPRGSFRRKVVSSLARRFYEKA